MRLLVFAACCTIISMVAAQKPRPKLDGPLSIARAISLAEQNNPGLSAGKSQVLVATAGVRSARSALSPQVSANSFGTTGSYGSILGSSPAVMPPFLLAVPSRGYLDQNLTLMMPLFTGGRLQSAINSASWQQQAAEGELAEVRADLRLRVQDAYLKALVAKQMVSVQEAKVAAAQELMKTTQARFEAGKGIEASVQRVQAELSRAERSLTSARNSEVKSRLDLDAAISIDFDSSITLTDDLSLAQRSGDLAASLRIARTSRGRLLAAKAKAAAAQSDVRGAEAQQAPQLYGQAMGDSASQRMGTGASFGLTLSFPIFDGGRIKAEVASAKAMKAKADAELSEVAISVESEVRQAWLDLETARANAKSAEASVKAAQSAYDVTGLRVSAGKGILVEQLDALQALTEAKGDLAQAIYDYDIALARLSRASGDTK